MNTELNSSVADLENEVQSDLTSDALLSPVPDCGSNPGDNHIAEWEKATVACVTQCQNLGVRKRAASRQMLAMITLDAETKTPEFYETRLTESGVSIPKNKEALTLALAHYMQLDVKNTDKKVANDCSKRLNQYSNAGRRLREIAGEKFGIEAGRLNVSYDENGVKALMKIIEEEKGIAAMALAGPAQEEDGVRESLIALSTDEHRRREQTMLDEKLSAGGEEIVFGLVRPSENGNLKIEQKIPVSAEMISLAAQTLNVADERIRHLHELFIVGDAVVEETSNHLVNREIDDINDPAAKRRVASRQFVFNPNGTLTISPILRDSSVVVVATPCIDLLGTEIKGHVRLQTYGRRRAALNLKDATRLTAFDLKITDPGDTEGIARVRLTTPVAKREEDKDKDVGMLIEHVRSNPGNYPLVVASSFSPKVALASIAGLGDKLKIATASEKALMKSVTPITISVADEKLSIEGMGKPEVLPLPGNTMKARVAVRPDDLSAVVKVIDRLQSLDDGVSLAFDANMAAIWLKTEFAQYVFHIPAAGDNLHRSDRHVIALNPIRWEEDVEILDPQVEPASDASQMNQQDQEAA